MAEARIGELDGVAAPDNDGAGIPQATDDGRVLRGGGLPDQDGEPPSVVSPASSKRSFTEIGIPARAGIAWPFLRRASMASAVCRAHFGAEP